VTSPDTSHSTPLIALDAVALDTETTGLDARIARLVQIGGVKIRQGALNSEERRRHTQGRNHRARDK
jgi:DNA polymerase III epsilon subunit-like protein